MITPFPRQRSSRFTWNEFFDSWHDYRSPVHTSYESLRSNPVRELRRICAELGAPLSVKAVRESVAKFTFEKMAGRKPGVQRKGTFFRKGIVGDWKTHFSVEAADAMARHVGDRIVKAGYERSVRWVEWYEDTIAW